MGLLVACATGCCATNRLWRAVDDSPVKLEGASLTRDGVLSLAMRYERGRTWVLTADLGEPGVEWADATARRVRMLEAGEPLPPSDHPVALGIPALGKGTRVHAGFMHHVDKSGDESNTVWVQGAGYEVVVHCPAPVDWGRGAAYAAAAATPFTVAVDIVTAPVHALWVLFTVGGHGDPWLPWCG